MRVDMFCDGGSRGNPGVAGSGSVVYGPDGETLAEVAYVVGAKASNNVAEYHGLLCGLEAAREIGATAVNVHMDSKLVVEQMTGRWKIKHPDMKKLAVEARALADTFDDVTYTWVPRAKNKKADELSNVAMDAAARGDAPGIVAGSDADTGQGGVAKQKPHEVAGPAHWWDKREARTRFVLLRHGQTEHSAERRFSGTSDPSLTETGRDQARRAAEALTQFGQIDAIVASPRTRAQETARAAADALGFDRFETLEGFAEIDFGDFEGLTRDEAIERDRDAFDHWQASPNNPPPGGESTAAFHRRVTRARLKLQGRFEGKTVLVVTHMMPIKSVVRQALGANAESFHHFFLDLASISVVEFYGDHGVVRSFNDCAHHRV